MPLLVASLGRSTPAPLGRSVTALRDMLKRLIETVDTRCEKWELFTQGKHTICFSEWNLNANAAFIQHSRTDIPVLLAEVRRLRELLQEAVDDIESWATYAG